MDFYGSTDLLIPDFATALATAVGELGFEPPSPKFGNWTADERVDRAARLGFTYVFLRANPSLAVAPTRLEIMAPHAVDPVSPPSYRADEVMRQQGVRPIKTHALTIAASNVDALVERAKVQGWRHRVDPLTETAPFPRLWIGFSDDEPSTYRPAVDGGLMIEFFPTLLMGRSFEQIMEGAGRVPHVADGGLVRIVARGVLVESLDHTVSRLANAFDWEPDQPFEVVNDEGCRRAVMPFRAPHSARLELLEAVGDGEAASFCAAYGPGPWQITISVRGLEAKRADLDRRGVAYRVLPAGPGRAVATLRARPGGGLAGAVVDFVDDDAWTSALRT